MHDDPVRGGIVHRLTNSAHRILHYIRRNVSVDSHQVTYFIRTFDALIRNNVYAFVKRYTSSYNFLICSLQSSDAFVNLQFLP